MSRGAHSREVKRRVLVCFIKTSVRDDFISCVDPVLLSLSLLQDGLPFTSQRLPASSFLQQADGEHVGHREVEEGGDDQEDDRGGKRGRVQ